MPDLSDSVNWSEIDANNNQAPPNGWPEGMMPSGVNDAARADRGALKRFWDKINPVQTISPSGGVWTFVTDNAAYPAAYVGGEMYCFRPVAVSVGGDQFQVNGLGAKPILKHISQGPTGWVPIIALDILQGVAVHLVYDAILNAGNGAFILLNPQVPITGTGNGGATAPGGLVIIGPDYTGPQTPAAAGNLNVYGGFHLSYGDGTWGYVLRSNVPVGMRNLALAYSEAGVFGTLDQIQLNAHNVSLPSGGVGINGHIAFGTPQTPDKTISWISRFAAPAGQRRIGVTGSDPGLVYYPLEEFYINAQTTTVTGTVSSVGYQSRSGVSGPSQPNYFNIQWTASGAHLWIDVTDQGPLVTAPGGNLSVSGTLSAGAITASGHLTVNSGADITGALEVHGGDLNITGGEHITGNLVVDGGTTLRSTHITDGLNVDIGLVVTGWATVSGGLTVDTGLVSNGHLTVNSDADVTGGLTVAGTTTLAGSLGVSGPATFYSSGSPVLSTSLGVVHIYAPPGQLSALEVQGGGLSVAGNATINGNLTVTGTINGHPAMALGTLTTQLEELTSRVAILEATIADLRQQVHALQG